MTFPQSLLVFAFLFSSAISILHRLGKPPLYITIGNCITRCMSQLEIISEELDTSTILYQISCLLGDIDLVVERLDDRYHHSDVSKIKDLADELLNFVDLLLDEPNDSSSLELLDLLPSQDHHREGEDDPPSSL